MFLGRYLRIFGSFGRFLLRWFWQVLTLLGWKNKGCHSPKIYLVFRQAHCPGFKWLAGFYGVGGKCGVGPFGFLWISWFR